MVRGKLQVKRTNGGYGREEIKLEYGRMEMFIYFSSGSLGISLGKCIYIKICTV